MASLTEYLIKFSVSLAVLYAFYRLVLHRLTFYRWNRFYLLCYSLLSFVLPFININPWIAHQQVIDGRLMNRIPAVANYSMNPADINNSPGIADWLFILFITGIVIMLIRLLIQYQSLKRVRMNAVLLQKDDDISLFGTPALISPFSFGKSVYVNPELHSPEDLHRIIQHEIVHVKQQHTVDLIVGELLCVFNWYNPFAWLIRKVIRQNLEFIADNNVIESGHDKKEYQYLLLKVVGVAQYSIANNFNLPDLKKRIIMMNKMKSAKLHLTRFLFVLPLMAIILLAFRSEQTKATERRGFLVSATALKNDTVPAANERRDTLSLIRVLDNKENGKKDNFILSIADNNGEYIAVVKDSKKGNIIKALTLEDWNRRKEYFENLYGKLPEISKKTVDNSITVIGRATADNTITITGEKAIDNSITVTGKKMADNSVTVTGKKSIDNVVTVTGKPRVGKGPLVLVDGVEQGPDFNVNSISPDMIEAVTVRKGSDATEKYGEKGANDVIEIQIKRVPLYILDGAEQPLSPTTRISINPDEIESMTVLKDKEALLKYGAKGKNGVIEIKTKKNSIQVAPVREP